NILDLLEPSHSRIILPYILENSKIPNEWGYKVLICDKDCDNCKFCHEVMKKILINSENLKEKNCDHFRTG
ncbi:hypothetical protein J7L87_00670, partial [bacterium]|nr:hypothetical protein [bacterium]